MFKVSIKGVLVGPDGRVVLLENERNEWELPGGQIEPGESPPQCLAREFQEELCLQVEVEQPLDTYLFEVTPGRHVFIATYKCAIGEAFRSEGQLRGQAHRTVLSGSLAGKSSGRLQGINHFRDERH